MEPDDPAPLTAAADAPGAPSGDVGPAPPAGTRPGPRRVLGLLAAVGAVAVTVAALLVVDRLAIGSSGTPAALLAAVAVAAVALAASLLARRFADPEATHLWLVAGAIVAFVATSVVAGRAPYDHARLDDALAELRLPGGTIAERRTGSPRCSPTCTTIERRVRLVGQTRQGVASTVINQINLGQLEFRRARSGETPDTVFFATASHPRYVLTYGIGKVEGDDAHVDVVYRAIAR